MFQFKLKSVFSFAKNDPNPWVLSQYASEHNTKTFLPAEQYKKLFQFPKSFGSAIIKSCWYPGSYLNFVEMEHCFSESVFLKLLRLVVLVSFTSYTSLALTLWLRKSFPEETTYLIAYWVLFMNGTTFLYES